MKFKYHFEPECGWMNDPNGLCYYNGEYHAFFQYNPYAPKWDVMHWGHAVSNDLVTWRQVETALYPDMDYEDEYGCFSGSALVENGKMHLFYTGVSHKHGQAQAHAVSDDGLHFKKDKSLLIACSPYADESGKNADFRDPKVFKAFGKYYMVCGSCNNNTGVILLYSSQNLIDWQYKGVIYQSDQFGGTLECPDMFPLDGKWVLMFSAMKPTVASTVFVTGEFNGDSFVPQNVCYSEYGKDFYAPQTFADDKGRRIVIGWFYSWGKALPKNANVAGALSVPRALFLKDGYVYNYPVDEAQGLLKEQCDYVKVSGTQITVYGLNGDEVFCRDLYGLNGLTAIESIKILFDEKAVEIFINGGLISLSEWLI